MRLIQQNRYQRSGSMKTQGKLLNEVSTTMVKRQCLYGNKERDGRSKNLFFAGPICTIFSEPF